MARWLLRVLLLLCFSVQPAAAGVQHNAEVKLYRPQTAQLNSETGLSQSVVLSMAEDQFNRLWVGTQDGVNIIDGNTVKVLNSSLQQPLAGKIILQIVADQQFGVWLATNNGLNRVDSRDFSVTLLQHPEHELRIIRSMALLAEQLALVANRQLYLLQLDSQQLTPVTHFTEVQQVLHISPRQLLVKTRDGFYDYWPDSGQFSARPVAAALLARTGKFAADGQQLYLAVQDDGVYQCPQGASCTKLALPLQSNVNVQDLVLQAGRLYALSGQGLLVTRLASGHSELLLPQQQYGEALHYMDLLVLYVSQAADLYIGGHHGLMFVPRLYQSISSFRIGQPGFSTLNIASASISTPQRQADTLAVATTDAVELYTVTTAGPVHYASLAYPAGAVPAHFIRLADQLYLATFQHGVLRLDPDSLTLQPQQQEFAGLPADQVLIDLLQLDATHRLALFHRQLILLQLQADGKYHPLWRTDLPVSYTAKLAYSQGRLFIAAYYEGLLSSHWPDWQQPPAQWQRDLQHEPVLNLRLRSPELLHVMTAEQGLLLATISGQQLQLAPLADAALLLNNTILCSVDLADGSYLLSSHNGVAHISADNRLLQQFTVYDGLVQREFNQYQCGKLDEHAYVGGDHGISLIGLPGAANQPPARLNWVRLAANGQSYPLTGEPQVFVAPDAVNISYAYAPYPLKAPVSFQYRLTPGNSDWLTTSGTSLIYTQLAQGDYQLQLRAVNYDNSLSAPISLLFAIRPPWWRSSWAYTSYGLLAFVLLWLIFRSRWQMQQARLELVEQQQRARQQHTDQLETEVRLRTEQLQLQQQELLLAQQEKNRFITAASHDLKHLSALIQLNLAFLQDKVPAASLTNWQGVFAGAKMLNKLVDDIVELAKLDAGIITPACQPLNLSQLLGQLCQQFAMVSQRRGIVLHRHYADNIRVLSDAHLLERLIMNLLDNAVKNLASGDSIQLQLQPVQPGRVQLLIRDSGPGMPEHIRQDWGRPFRRGISEYHGSGLGLSIVRRIAELLALPVSLHSSAGGSCFTLELPLAGQEALQQLTGNGHVAVIDDDPQVRQSLSLALQRHGLNVSSFASIDEFSRATQGDYQLLISDVHLGHGQDGLSQVALYRSRLQQDGKLVLISGDASARQRVAAHSGVYFLLKPVKPSRLAWLLTKGTQA